MVRYPFQEGGGGGGVRLTEAGMLPRWHHGGLRATIILLLVKLNCGIANEVDSI